ncbi:MAG: 2-hydroxyacyl-CoA dehydratase, partial [Chloroflexi bacterium]|nr:2-hydroxyacyl-CoA dehydratase [Chloroflexota bacterium]
ELGTFQKALERFTGRKIAPDDLRRSVALYNRQRSLVRRLYQFKKSDPPGITGGETIKTLVAVMSLPVEEANELLEDVIAELGSRKAPQPANRGPRVMVYGTGNEDTVFVDLVESLGARVVADELCFGTRSFWHSVDPSGEPLAMMARSYLDQINCPRTFRQSPGTHEEDLQNRFGRIHEMASEYGASGVICFFMRYCDTHGFDLPDLKEYMAQKRMPMLVLEEEYPVAGSLDRLRTRLETFIEIIGQ